MYSGARIGLAIGAGYLLGRGRLSEYAKQGGPGLIAALGGGKRRKGGGKLKVTTIVEAIDVGVPARVAYDQWTRLNHWRSKGEKGSVDGTVSFHELAPDLTRILVVLEYHPRGLFEHTGNLWRAQGRRVRLELEHFVRHVMTQTVLDPDSVQGWRGEIEDSQVVGEAEEESREEAEEEPREERRPTPRGRRRPAPRRRPAEDEYDEDEYDEGDYAEYDEEEQEEQPAPRRRAPARARRSREEPRPRRAPEAPRRPVVRRRREEVDK